MKKITSCFLAFIMILMLIPSICGYAAQENKSADVNYDTGVITVQGNTGIQEEKLINITILYPDAEMNQLTVDNFKQKVFCTYEMLTKEDGSYFFDDTFLQESSVPAEHIGWYTVIISVEGMEQTEDEKSTKFYYADATTRENAIAAVNGMTEENITSVLNTYKDTIGITLGEDYTSAQSTVNSAMLYLRNLKKQNGGAGYITLENIKNDFADAQWIGNMKHYESVDTEILVKKSEQKLVAIVPEDYANNKKTVWNNFMLLRKGRDMVKCEDVQKVFNEALALCMINSSNREVMRDVLENYNDDVLNLDLGSRYQKYDLEITKTLTGKDFQSIDEFCKAFKKALENAVSGGESSSGSSSGGGGGGTSINVDNVIITPGKQQTGFSDINDAAWAKAYLTELVEKGIVNGYEDNTIRPNKVVSREEFLKMLVEALGLPKDVSANNFTDVSSSAWYSPYISTAVKHGISTGRGDGTFGIGENIKREDMAVMACRALEKLNINFSEKSISFSDKESISSYASESVSKLSSVNIIGGRDDGSFCPNDFATRAEAAKIICGIMNYREEGVK